MAGCTGQGEPADGADEPAEGGGTVVRMADTAFDPIKASVAPGSTVEWVNEDAVRHDVTARNFHNAAVEWDFAATVRAGERTSHTFEEAGIYEYYCSIHGEATMCGVVLVGDVSLDASLPCEGGGGGGGYY